MPGPSRASSLLACLVAAAVLGGCSSATQTSTSRDTSSPSASSVTIAPGRTITITVRGKQVTPAPTRVEMRSSDVLRLVVTSDHDDELHAHGYDVERELVAGQPTTVDLTGAAPGLYAVETHDPELNLLQVEVRP